MMVSWGESRSGNVPLPFRGELGSKMIGLYWAPNLARLAAAGIEWAVGLLTVKDEFSA